MPGDALGADLRRLIGAEAVSTDEATRISAGTDFVTRRGVPAAVVRPTTNGQIIDLVRYAGEHSLAVVSRGAATNLSAAMMPSEASLLMDLSMMNRIIEIDAERRRAVVEAGVVNADLRAAVAPLGLTYAPDPASASLATLGGNIAENAGGPGCIKNGVTFHHVLGLDVVLGDGRLVRLTDEDDVDLLGVTIGSEGILGVVTHAALNLIPVPAMRWTALAGFECMADAASTVSQIIAAGVLPAALELCDRRFMEILEKHHPSGYPVDREAMIIVELNGEPDEVRAEIPLLERVLKRRDPQVRIAKDERERAALWAGRLAAGFALHNTGKLFYICDATVPRQRLPEMVARTEQIAAGYGFDIPVLGHAGDGNLHPVILHQPDQLATVSTIADEIACAAIDLGGTLTGEHGIGTAKRDLMRRAFGPTELAAFRAIKRAFDPAGLFNPDVALPSATPEEPNLAEFGAVVAAVLAGSPVSTATATAAHDTTVVVDAENMSVTAGGEACCRDVAAAVRAAGLSCPAMENDARVADLVDVAGHRQPMRRALLAVEAILPGGRRAKFGSSAMKDVAGLDAKRLIAGGRGAFGTVERVTLRAAPTRS